MAGIYPDFSTQARPYSPINRPECETATTSTHVSFWGIGLESPPQPSISSSLVLESSYRGDIRVFELRCPRARSTVGDTTCS